MIKISRRKESVILTKFNILGFTLCVLIALCVCMMSPLNPLSSSVSGTDSSVFLTIAKGMSKGAVPYRDFFDHKGPLLYILNYCGWLIGKTLGVWFIEFILMCFSTLYAYRTLKLFVDSIPAYIGVLFGFITLGTYFEGGNLTEEYVLPFIIVSLYFFVRFFTGNQRLKHYESIIIGFCFGCSVMLRPNMFTIWAVFCTIVFITMIIQKKYKNAFAFALMFIFGFTIIILPIVVYLLINGAIKDFIFQYFIFNARYASEGMTIGVLIENTVTTMSKGFFWLLLSGPVFWLFYTKDLLRVFHGSCFAASIFTIVFIVFSSATYNHYSMVIVPLVVIQVGLLSGCLYEVLKRKNVLHTVLCMFLVFGLLFVHPISYCIGESYAVLSSQKIKEMKAISDIINGNSNPNDTIISIGNNCQIYLYTDLKPASKYIYQTIWFFYDFKSDILNHMPNIIIIPNNSIYTDHERKGVLPENVEFVNNLIDAEYTELVSTVSYKLYKKW